MKIVVTGSSGRVGRAIYNQLAAQHEVVGIDRTPFSTTQLVGDFADADLLAEATRGADAIIHTAALHAPHVGVLPDSEFERINVAGTRLVVEAALLAGVPRLVFTSTTALFGQTIEQGRAAWVTDETTPQPRSIYHRSKLAAEAVLQAAAGAALAVRVIRMSRCFPETADLMALYRLSRGVDVRDVAKGARSGAAQRGPGLPMLPRVGQGAVCRGGLRLGGDGSGSGPAQADARLGRGVSGAGLAPAHFT